MEWREEDQEEEGNIYAALRNFFNQSVFKSDIFCCVNHFLIYLSTYLVFVVFTLIVQINFIFILFIIRIKRYYN